MRPQIRWGAIAAATAAVLAALLFLPACCCVRSARLVPAAAVASASPAIGTVPFPLPTEAAAKAPTETQMANVWFRLDPLLFLDIHSLRGDLAAKQPGAPVNFDDKHSFVMHVDRAEIGMTPASLDRLMNGYVFAYRDPPLRDLRFSIEGKQLRQEGVMHKIVDIPFTMWADVSADHGRIRVHPTKIDICGINGLGLLKAVGMTLQKMLPMPAERGVQAEKNDLLIDPNGVLPPPQVELTLVAATVAGGELVQTFDAGRKLDPLPPPHLHPSGYMYFRSGTLRMGKLLMVDADMEVVSTRSSGPFDFFLDGYNQQLSEGFTRNQRDYGLLVYMRNFADVGRPPQPAESLAP